jgi:hypothetical protein
MQVPQKIARRIPPKARHGRSAIVILTFAVRTAWGCCPALKPQSIRISDIINFQD